ncbi:MAG: 2,3,4,5-tetrahydropyridine-2,6-dicarboxylate N-succinyltransferase, partial [Tidjanibacter sp.]|nr:2,3,4,5-tetrahydropyridine-2,6-dicarboxylate N-succinyltransferase [Tidjanibacter sp.]
MYNDLKDKIEAAWMDAEQLHNPATLAAIEEVVDLLDKGILRVAEPTEDGNWQVNEWVKKAVILYFPTHGMKT